jgi:CBS domain-containing protein
MPTLGVAIIKYMTVCPITIGADQPLSTAHKVMRKRGIRHLPVLRAGELVGLVSQRDLYFLETIAGVDPETVRVEEAMSDAPYVVDPGASVRHVVREMADKKYGCAIVAERGEVMGLFTTVDALRLLSDLLESERTAKGMGRRAPTTRRAS